MCVSGFHSFPPRIYHSQDNFALILNLSCLIGMHLDYAQVVEEMLDNGFPMITEPNILMQMIEPPSNVCLHRRIPFCYCCVLVCQESVVVTKHSQTVVVVVVVCMRICCLIVALLLC